MFCPGWATTVEPSYTRGSIDLWYGVLVLPTHRRLSVEDLGYEGGVARYEGHIDRMRKVARSAERLHVKPTLRSSCH